MTVDRHLALLRVWRRVPPVHVQLARIAGALGMKPARASEPNFGEPSPAASADEMAELLGAMPQLSALPKVITMAEYLERKKHG
jgi:hypothetical protein